MVAHTACLGRASGRIGLGIEIQYDGLALQLRETDWVSVLVRQFKVWSGIASREHQRQPIGSLVGSRLGIVERLESVAKHEEQSAELLALAGAEARKQFVLDLTLRPGGSIE